MPKWVVPFYLYPQIVTVSDVYTSYDISADCALSIGDMKKFQAPFRQETYLKRERERNTWIVPNLNQSNASLSISIPLPLPRRQRKEIMLNLSILMVRRSD